MIRLSLSLPVALAGAITLSLAACGPREALEGGCDADLFAGDLVITEIFANPEGKDDGKEWFEIYNATASAIDLKGVVLIASKEDTSGAEQHVMTDTTIAAGQYLVVGAALPDLIADQPHMDYGYGPALSLRQSGRIAIVCGSTIVDETNYPEMPEATSLALDGAVAPDYTANDSPDNWCPSEVEYATGAFGSPKEANPPCGTTTPGQCSEGGVLRDVVSPAPGDLVITEIMANPDAANDETGEWFEVLVNADVDLNGLAVGTTPGEPEVIVGDGQQECLHVAAGTYVVFAASLEATDNGGLPVASYAIDFGLSNSGDSLYLGTGDQVLDQVTWQSGDVYTGAATSLDPGSLDPTANDDFGVWCEAVDVYGAGDKGTPGAENPACDFPLPDGMCEEEGVARAIVAPVAGDITISEWMANPDAVTDDKGEWFEAVASADFDLNGLELGTVDPVDGPQLETTIQSRACLPVTAGSFVVFSNNGDMDTNGGLPKVDAVISFGLTNSDSGVFVGAGGEVLDQVSYATTEAGASTMIDDAGTTCTTPPEKTYGLGDIGTPTVANPACPAAVQ
ncbi:MAG TPA: lamin tail domain-containing protein [Kofleriaceae bacterium]|nr:lamin tail domain-containing protein [Kofleriaceae bacterium]